ncbi:MAG: type II toxin-antitoxin system VapC family toxin [Mariprofundales bacterium]
MTWQQITMQWWQNEREAFELFTSELVLVEAGAGDPSAAAKRVAVLDGVPELMIDETSQSLAEHLISGGGLPSSASADALHIAVATVFGIDYLLTWNCRHIDNAVTKPVMRKLCAELGYRLPEICTPMELMMEGDEDVSG